MPPISATISHKSALSVQHLARLTYSMRYAHDHDPHETRSETGDGVCSLKPELELSTEKPAAFGVTAFVGVSFGRLSRIEGL